MHIAASLQHRRAHVGAVKLLMRKGADPSARNLENEQPVHLVSDGPVGEEVRLSSIICYLHRKLSFPCALCAPIVFLLLFSVQTSLDFFCIFLKSFAILTAEKF